MRPRDYVVDRYLRADIERGFILAYYQHVKGLEVMLDGPTRDGQPFVAFATGDTVAYAMDFSSRYEFPEEMRPATAARRLRERVEALQIRAPHWTRAADPEVLYEICCFIPPKKALYAYNEAVAEKLPVRLVGQEEIRSRVRETVLAVPTELRTAKADHITAFEEAAIMLREAFGLKP